MRKFILGDCMDLETGLPSYPDKFFDLAIVDPPYGIGVNMNTGRRKEWTVQMHENKKWDNLSPDAYYFAELIRVSRNQIIWGGNHFVLPVSRGWIFWDKLMPDGLTFSDGELAWTSFDVALKKAKYTYTNYKGGDNGGKIHPTQKPVALYRWLLENYAKPGQLILDTHVGSASSLIACESMGFDYVGFEIDPDYYAAAKNRMSKGIQAVLI
jgi:site-specific DNA-methyltransferase (adenine-specific)